MPTEGDERRPLPGQLTFPQLEPLPPPTRWKRLKEAWREGRAAAIAGKTLDEMPGIDEVPRRGWGESIAARKAHTHWAREWQRFWRDGFEAEGGIERVGLFARK